MARENRIVINQLGLMRIRVGWPELIKEDCAHFNITLKQLADESKISPTRISYMRQGVAVYESKIERMNELTRLTLAFNRIIDRRMRGDERSKDFSY